MSSNPQDQRQRQQPEPFEPGKFLPGGHNNDPPLPTPSATTGYKLNHMMLRIRDPARSLPFYIDLLGMRTVFTMNAGPFTLYYLGYPPTADDCVDLPTWASKTASFETLTQTPGLLELYHVHGSERDVDGVGVEVSTGNTPPALGFGHLGFTVPDARGAVERLRAEGVRVVKEVGCAEREHVPLSEWEKKRGVGVGEMHEGYRAIFERFAVVADPDGYLIELIPQSLD